MNVLDLSSGLEQIGEIQALLVLMCNPQHCPSLWGWLAVQRKLDSVDPTSPWTLLLQLLLPVHQNKLPVVAAGRGSSRGVHSKVVTADAILCGKFPGCQSHSVWLSLYYRCK